MKMNEYMERTEQVVLHTYNRFPVVFEKGEGVHLYDTEGKEYLDFGAGSIDRCYSYVRLSIDRCTSYVRLSNRSM